MPLALAAVALLAMAAAGPARGDTAKRPRWQTVPLPLPAMPKPSSSGHVALGKAKIWYGIYGDVTGEPVVLLHGGLGNSDHWAHQVPALAAAKYRVIAIDSRGQGRSTLGDGKLSYHGMAGDVVAVLDALEVSKAAIVGWSDGGAIALDLAIHHPRRVAKLFVFGTNYDAKGSKPNKRPSATFAAYNQKCKGDHARLGNPHDYAAVLRKLVPVWRTQGGFTKDQLRSIQAPTVVSDGDHDEIVVLAQIEEMAKLIPNARLVVFAETSHFALWQDPAAFNRALLEFLDRR